MSRERRFYTEDFKEQVLSAYNSRDESAAEIARRFQINHDTVKSWVYRKRTMHRMIRQKALSLRNRKQIGWKKIRNCCRKLWKCTSGNWNSNWQ
jgi:transposase-like protein